MNTLNTKKISLRRLVYSAVCLALCLLLPFLTGQIPQVGKALSPMHIPVLLGGFLCGPWWAALVGLIAPVLRSLLFSSPALFPMATAMSFELAAYGLGAGLLYRLLPHRVAGVYGALAGPCSLAVCPLALPCFCCWAAATPGRPSFPVPSSPPFPVSFCICS